MFTDTVKFLQKAVVFHPDEVRFLALKRMDNAPVRASLWDLPGGNVDYGEQHDHAILREVKEETQLEISRLRVSQVVTHFNPENQRYWLFIGHTCCATNDTVTLSGEHSDFCWLEARDFLTLSSTPFLQFFVQHVFELE